MNKSFETTTSPDLQGNSPIAYAARWFGTTESEIHLDDTIEGKEYWQQQLDRLETVAMVDPGVMLEIARIQQADEETPEDERFLQTGNLIQLALMTRMLNDRAAMVAEVLSANDFPVM